MARIDDGGYPIDNSGQPPHEPTPGYQWEFIDGQWVEVPIPPGPTGPQEPIDPGPTPQPPDKWGRPWGHPDYGKDPNDNRPPTCCFVAGTLVTLADGTPQAIQAITVGQRVRGRDRLNTVTDIRRTVLGARGLVAINGGTPYATVDHAFWTGRGWAVADPELFRRHYPHADYGVTPLRVGDEVETPTGPVRVTQIGIVEGDPETPLWDLTLDGDHAYFAGGYLAHNCSPVPDWKAKAQAFLEGLSRQYGVPIQPGDIDQLAGLGAGMDARFADFEAQYKARGKGGPTPPPGGGGTGPTTRTASDYPSWAPPSFDYPDFAPPAPTAKPFMAPAPKAGDWTPPSWDLKPYEAATPFEYPAWQEPTADTFKADPGYDFRAKEMERAIINAKAPLGALASPATLKELMSYRGNLASQEYGNVRNRQFGGWQANRAAAFETADFNERNRLQAYKEQFGAESEEYKRALTDYNVRRAADQDALSRATLEHSVGTTDDQTAFNRALTEYLTGYGRKSDDWNRNLTAYTTNRDTNTGNVGMGLDAAQLALAQNNSRWGNLLSLYNIASRTLPTYNPTALPAY